MPPPQQLRLLLLAWLLGLVLALWLPLFLASLGVLGLGLVFLARPNFYLGAALITLLSTVYSVWYQQQFYPDSLSALVGEALELQGTVQGEARVRSGRQTVRLKVQAYRAADKTWQPLSGQLLWSFAPLPVFNPGDSVRVQGTIGNVTNFSDDFDAKAYWARWGVEQQLVRGQLITRPPATTTQRDRGRAQATERLQYHLQTPHLTVALGMLVGLKDKLPQHLDEAFKKSGLTHLLVVSGTNVTLLVVLMAIVLKGLGPWWRYGLGAVVILAYLYLVGFDPPALRATVFGLIVGLAVTGGQFVEYRNAFLLVAVLLSVYDPRFVTHDVSFHLSFGATAGLLFGVPVFYWALWFIPWPKLRLLLCATTAAQLAVFPILIYQFGSFPYIGLLTNLVTEPLVPLIMALAAGGVLLGDTFLLGLESLWSSALWASIESLIALAQLGAQAPELVLPAWSAWPGFIALLLLVLWASFSHYYQRELWEKFEAEISA